MTLSKYAILLILLTLHASTIFSQKNQNFISDSIKAREINRKANYLGLDGLHIQALDTFFHGLELRKRIYGNEHYNLAAVYSGIGITYRTMGQYDQALKYFELAEKNYQLSPPRFSSRNKTKLYLNIGNVYKSKFDYKNALNYYNQTIALSLNDANSSIEDIANINYKIADIYYLINDFDKSLEIINENIGNAYLEDQILYYELLAFINQVKGNSALAKNNYLKAINLTIETNDENHINIAIEYLNYAQFLINESSFQESKEILKQAYEIIRLTEPEKGEVLSAYYAIMGFLSRSLPIETSGLALFSEQKYKNTKEALNYYLNGLRALNFPVPYSLENLKNSNQWVSFIRCTNLLKEIADVHTEIADTKQNKKSDDFVISLNDAINNYQIAAALIQKARKEISSDESKVLLTELEHSTFHNLVEVAHDLYEATGNLKYMNIAFQGIEKVKSSSVFDQLSNQLALENSLIPDSLIQLEQRYNNTITIYSEKLYQESNVSSPDSSLINEYNTMLFEANRGREELNNLLEIEYKDYYDLKYSESLFSIDEIQQQLLDDETLIEYILNENDTTLELYTLLISKEDLIFNQQEVGSEFSKSIENIFYFMSDTEYMLTTNDDAKKYCNSAHLLYNKLILPVKNDIINKRLIIVPDGRLSYIPFDALIEELPDTTSAIKFNRLKYLIKTYDINYSNSANLLFKFKAPRKKFKNQAIAFAPVYHSDTVVLANQPYTLLPLPGVQTEVDLISETIKTKTYKADNATEINFRENIEDFDILHLAMHAFINDSLPAFSRLAFAQTPSENTSTDGWINTTDIYNLNLNARLAVLSACNTGRGQLKKGEGLLSLARGFFYAGCPSIVMSLWEVEDQSGTQIMGSFYKHLKKGKYKSEALRLAKLEYLEEANSRRAHPHYWLGYVCYGDNFPLYKSYDFYFFSILVLILLGILLDQVYRIKKARKKRAF